MKAKNFLLALALCFVGATLCAAEDLNVGTWKLNEAKSQIPAGTMKNVTVVYETQGDSVKVTTDGSAGMASPCTPSGRASTMAKTIRLRAIPLQTHGRTERSTTITMRWPTKRMAKSQPAVTSSCRRTVRAHPEHHRNRFGWKKGNKRRDVRQTVTRKRAGRPPMQIHCVSGRPREFTAWSPSKKSAPAYLAITR